MAELIMQEELAEPATPGTGKWKLYFKSDGLYIVDDAGNEIGPLIAVTGMAIASQAEMETGTENGKAASPLSTNWHPGVAKFWIKFNGTGTIAIDASHNVTSITDNGTGDYTVTIATDFSSANWAWVCTPFDIVGQFAGFPTTGTTGAQAAGSIRFTCAKRSDGAAYDPSSVYCAGFGDQ